MSDILGLGDNVFHKHLDVCKRCDEQPFNLCPAGAVALKEAAARATEEMDKLCDLPHDVLMRGADPLP